MLVSGRVVEKENHLNQTSILGGFQILIFQGGTVGGRSRFAKN